MDKMDKIDPFYHFIFIRRRQQSGCWKLIIFKYFARERFLSSYNESWYRIFNIFTDDLLRTNKIPYANACPGYDTN